ncbi:uroporphyrinogen III synthase [Cinnamomum micranthum f. kanehirae]|uniref:Uroporphyrinogen III synthase n=1 Tax=Cinnamomum micranthum f. kanehirae TaxID=337451 RepID=A0A3S3MZ54_9MAGN|nr:uroporphyrinogen III synthase [Cinnamomum micranthum f. kanehirae]
MSLAMALPLHISSSSSSSPDQPLSNKRIAFTTPLTYATRLARLLKLQRSIPLHCPTILIQPSLQTKASLAFYLQTSHLQPFSAIAFTSRNGIAAFSESLSQTPTPPLPETGPTFTISALGKDADLLDRSFIFKLCKNPTRIRVLVPPIATPISLAESLGAGAGRQILCPCPLVVDLEEPPVIPEFLQALRSGGWIPVRVPAYETRWAGPRCGEALWKEELVDAVVFTSTAEVEGLLKSLREMGFGWGEVTERWPGMVVAAHGPVTAAGAERLGVGVDVMSRKFGSFDGVVEALAAKWGRERPDSD